MARVSARLEQEPSLLAAYLLGSAARGSLRPDSDVDIALMPMGNARLGGIFLVHLGGELSELARRPVDLGLLSASNLIYARQALLTGRRIMCRDPLRAGLTEAELLGLAAQLDFERQEIVRAYSA